MSQNQANRPAQDKSEKEGMSWQAYVMLGAVACGVLILVGWFAGIF